MSESSNVVEDGYGVRTLIGLIQKSSEMSDKAVESISAPWRQSFVTSKRQIPFMLPLKQALSS